MHGRSSRSSLTTFRLYPDDDKLSDARGKVTKTVLQHERGRLGRCEAYRKNEKGEKDFSEIIKQALELGGFREDQEKKEILVGFGHAAALSQADKIVEAVKGGQIRHFFPDRRL